MLVLGLEQVLEQALAQGQVLELELGQALVQALGLAPVRHSQQQLIHSLMPQSSLRLVLVVSSFSPPTRILVFSRVKIFSVESYHLLFHILGYSP